jgi:hypothetical protein
LRAAVLSVLAELCSVALALTSVQVSGSNKKFPFHGALCSPEQAAAAIVDSYSRRLPSEEVTNNVER